MKFVSKNSRLNIILRPGISANHLTGQMAKPTIFVQFEDGLAEVTNPELIDMMLQHPGYNGDFYKIDNDQPDPYAYLRASTEPQHVITEIKHGTPMGRNVSPVQVQLPPEIRKMIQEQATSIAKQMLPGMVEAVLKDIVAKKDAQSDVPDNMMTSTATSSTAPDFGQTTGSTVTATTPRRPGRPKKNVEA